MGANTVLIEARKLERHYQRGSETVKALDGVDLSVRPGEMISVLGPSGSGKTTLINVLSCLDASTRGTLLVQDRNVTGFTEDKLVEVRRGFFGFIFQKFYLLPTLTVRENIELPLLFLRRSMPHSHSMGILALVGLADRQSHFPRQLSGGQMQRVAIARALALQPKVLVADEPTGNLDKANGEAIFALFRRLLEGGVAVLVTTHNLALGYTADRVITLEDGKIVREERGRGAQG